jgi:hypothetical protein
MIFHYHGLYLGQSSLALDACCAFFGLGIILAALNIFGANNVILTPQGLIFSIFWRRTLISWKDIKSFKYVSNIGRFGSDFIGFDYADTYVQSAMLRNKTKNMSGVEGILLDQGSLGPMGQKLYGMKGEDLANLLNDWRNKYGA